MSPIINNQKVCFNSGGASSGIAEPTAEYLAVQGFHVYAPELEI